MKLVYVLHVECEILDLCKYRQAIGVFNNLIAARDYILNNPLDDDEETYCISEVYIND